jgi:hypothetical protein
MSLELKAVMWTRSAYLHTGPRHLQGRIFEA